MILSEKKRNQPQTLGLLWRVLVHLPLITSGTGEAGNPMGIGFDQLRPFINSCGANERQWYMPRIVSFCQRGQIEISDYIWGLKPPRTFQRSMGPPVMWDCPACQLGTCLTIFLPKTPTGLITTNNVTSLPHTRVTLAVLHRPDLYWEVFVKFYYFTFRGWSL